MVSFGLRVQGYQSRGTCIPDFDRLVVRARDDLGSVVVEGDGGDVAAVRVRLLRLELQGSCSKRGSSQI